MKKIFLLFVFSFSVMLSFAQQALQRIRFEHLSLADGLPENSVRCMLQDHLGFMWLGTQNGLVRYDGNKIISFPYSAGTTNGFRGKRVDALLEDQQGDIWIRSEILVRFERSTQRFIEYPDKYGALQTKLGSILLHEFVHQDKEGFIWSSRHINDNDGKEYILTRLDPKKNNWAYFTGDPNNSHHFSGNDLGYGFAENKDGKIWAIMHGQNENTLLSLDRNTDKFILYHPKLSSTMAEDFKKINSIESGDKGVLYLSAAGKGFFIVNTQTGEIKQFRHNAEDRGSLLSDTIRTIHSDKRGFLWINNSRGLDIFDPLTNIFTHHVSKPGDLSTPGSGWWVLSYYETPEGNIWFETPEISINFCNPKTNLLIRYEINNKQEDALWGFILSTIADRTGLVWMGSLGYGLNKESRTCQFPVLKNIPGNNSSLQDNYVTSIYEAPSEPGIIWFGTENGLDRYNKKTGTYTHYKHDDHNANSITEGRISASAEDKKGRFWVGINARGAGLNLMDRKKGSFIHFAHDSSTNNSLINNWVRSLKAASDGTLWIGYENGLDHFDYDKNKFTHYQKADTSFTGGIGDDNVLSINEDSKKNIWIGTYKGGVIKFNPTTGKFVSHLDQFKGPFEITGGILEDSKTGNFWVGDYIFGLLLMNPKGEILKTYNASNGLSCNSVVGIEMDTTGILLISTENGLCRFDPVTEKFQLYNKKNGLQGMKFNWSAVGKTYDGELYFGGENGVNAFYPNQIKLDTIPPLVVLTDLDINGKPATIGKDAQMPMHISVAKDIELTHDLNELTFYFTSLLFDRGNESQFAYRLSPIDKDWVKSWTIRQARYNNLSPGDYTFTVKAANADGVWNETGTSIIVHILPPWWRTWWAYILYAFVFMGSIYGFIAFRSAALRKENKILEGKVGLRTNQLQNAIENLKATQSQLIQSEKMASLGELTAGIAHEIQNPLNFVNNFSEVNKDLLTEMNEEIDKGNFAEVKAISKDVIDNEEKINHHGKRADAIVKGMLQHSRSSTGVKEPTDINALADEYLRLSYHGLRAKDNSFNVTMKTDFDASIGKINIIAQDIGRVLLNLYNNAFYAVNERFNVQSSTLNANYTPVVSVQTKRTGSQVSITVSDNGNGIPQKVVDKIFQPFFTTKPTGQGTGLGLSLSYDIIKAHGGEIKVNTKENEGSEFIIELPLK